MAFGKVRHSQILSEAGNTWDIEIYKNGFTGTSLEFNMQGEGFEIIWNGQGETLDTQFLGSELTLNYYVQNQTDENFMYNEVLGTGEKNFYIRIYKIVSGGAKSIWWYGWLIPAFNNIENTSFPYVVQLTATDSYGLFKSRDKDSFFDYNDKISYKKITEIIGFESPPSGASANDKRGFMGRMNLIPDSVNNDTPCPFYINGSSGAKTSILKTQIQWFRRNPNSSIKDFIIQYLPNNGAVNRNLNDPFFNYYFSKSVFSEADAFDENNEQILPTGSALEYKESDVFDSVLKCFGAVGFLSEGSYLFRQPFNFKDETDGTVTTTKYESVSNMSTAIQLRPPLVSSSDLLTINQTTNVVLGGSILNYEPSFKKVSINFNEGFNIITVIKDTLISPGSKVQVGTLTNIDHGTIVLEFSALATEVIAEPAAFNSGLSPRYTVDNTIIDSGGVRTNSRLTITLLKPNGARLYLKEVPGSTKLIWGGNDQVQTLNIFRGNNVYSSEFTNNPINRTPSNGGMCPNLNLSNFNRIESTNKLIFTELTSGVRTTRTKIVFNCTIEKPPVAGIIEIEMNSRNNDSSSFDGYYSQAKTSGSTNYTGFPTAPNFTSNKTEVDRVVFYYEDVEEGESITSTVTYDSNQTTVPSSKTNVLGTSLLGQTNISPLLSIGFREGTSSISGGSPSTYPIMNETDKFVIKPCFTNFVRGNPSSFTSLNLLSLLVKERLNLQSSPLEVLQADIFSSSISPSKLIKYSINNNSSFKYYIFKGGTFKAKSDTMSGEWFKINEETVTITTGVHPSLGNGFSSLEERIAELTEKIANQDALIETIAQSNSFATLSASRTTKTSYTDLAVTAIPQALLSTQSLKLTMPDGSSPVFLAITSNVSAGVTVLPFNGGFILDQTYPVGSLISLNQSVTAPTP